MPACWSAWASLGGVASHGGMAVRQGCIIALWLVIVSVVGLAAYGFSIGAGPPIAGMIAIAVFCLFLYSVIARLKNPRRGVPAGSLGSGGDGVTSGPLAARGRMRARTFAHALKDIGRYNELR